ncbi:MAG: tetratricopeptide repeat protein [Candidatus Riflebacteria bacterium]|nr:tetratricopeptide repeat protein [Candidatus Riflebacteria bacterium]
MSRRFSFQIPRVFSAHLASAFFFVFLVFQIPCPVQASVEDDARISNRDGVMKARHGEWEGAIDAFTHARLADPSDDTALANLASAHNNYGVLLCREEKYAEGIASFEAARGQKPEDLEIRLNLLSALVMIHDVERVDREARGILALRPKDPQTLLKVANAFSRIEDDESARNLLERILAVEPNHPEALFCLGRLYYQQGNPGEARFYLQRAMEAQPGYASASAMLRRIGREDRVEKEFESESSMHFTLTFAGTVSHDWVRDLLDQFEDAYTKVGDLLGCYPSQRSQVIVYSHDDFRRVSSLPGWAGGLYDGKIRLPISPSLTRPEQARGAVFHEYCHHLVHILSSGNCPTWLNEGLAQYVEGVLPARARDILIAPPAPNPVSLRLMAAPFSGTVSRKLVERLYAQSLLIVSLLIEDRGMPSIQALLSALSHKNTLDQALAGAFETNLDALDDRLKHALE